MATTFAEPPLDLRSALRRVVLPSLAVFGLARVVQILALALAPQRRGRSLLDLLTGWDSRWYMSIADHGYAPPPPLSSTGVYTKLSDLAFFPLFPATIKIFSWALDTRVAALVAALVAGAVAAVLMALWAQPRAGAPGAVALVAMWSLWPSSVVLSMGYSEALFSATVAGCLLGLQRRSYVWAAVACSLAGLTRSIGAALVVALVAVLIARRPPLRQWLPAVLLAPLGLLLALGHVALVTGHIDGWYWVERTKWRSGFDGGTSMVSIIHGIISGRYPAYPALVMGGVSVVVAVATATTSTPR